jgi:Putative MetA-pathway of phenol degradation
MKLAICLAAVFYIFCVAPAGAFAGGLTTDRPDVAESSLTVDKGSLQIEAGIDAERFDGSSMLVTPIKLRYGIMEDLEIHLESDLLNILNTDETKIEVGDIAFGGKIHLLDNKGIIPSLGFLLALSIPLDGFYSDVAYMLHPTLAMDWSLASWLGLGVNLGLSSPLTDREIISDRLRFAAALGFSVPGVDQLGLFLEGFGYQPLGDGDMQLFVDGGATYSLSDSFQLDAYLRSSVNGAESLGGGVGFAVGF